MFQNEPPAQAAQTPHKGAKARTRTDHDATLRACTIALKVVPGSRKTEVAGAYGDRLKVKVAAPPEDGRANDAVCELVAGALGVARRDVEVVSGLTNPLKTLRVRGVSAEEARARLMGT